MLKMLENVSDGKLGEVDGFGLDEIGLDEIGLDEMTDPEGLLSMPELGFMDEGLGAVHKRRRGGRRRRLSSKTKAKLRRAARRRRRTAKGQFADLAAGKKRKRKNARKGGKARRRLSRIAKRRARTASGRFKKGHLAGLAGADDTFMDFAALSSSEDGFGGEDGLGAVKTRKRRRRMGRKARSKRGRKGRRRGRRMAGLGHVAEVGDAFGQAEVAASMPILGVFQWLATPAGLGALGGVALAPIFGAIIGKAMRALNIDLTNPLAATGGAILTSVALWEFGRLVNVPNISKFGAFYIFGRLLETQLTNPFIIQKVGLAGLGTMRIPDVESNLGTMRVPDVDQIGAESMTEEELLGADAAEDEVGAEDSDLF